MSYNNIHRLGKISSMVQQVLWKQKQYAASCYIVCDIVVPGAH